MNESSYTSSIPNHSLAIVSLVLSILGLIAILPVIGPIGGVITGYMAQREIRQNPTQYSGDNFARAGIILGWIGIALSIIFLTLLCLGLLFFIPVTSQTGIWQ